jgi:hypothetical protein
VHVPAQPLLTGPPLRDQVVAVIDEQLQLAQRLLTHPRTIEQRLLQRGSRDRERVDPVITSHVHVRVDAAAPSTVAAPAPTARPRRAALVRGCA